LMIWFFGNGEKEMSDVGQKWTRQKLESIDTHIKKLLTVVHTNAPPTHSFFRHSRWVCFASHNCAMQGSWCSVPGRGGPNDNQRKGTQAIIQLWLERPPLLRSWWDRFNKGISRTVTKWLGSSHPALATHIVRAKRGHIMVPDPQCHPQDRSTFYVSHVSSIAGRSKRKFSSRTWLRWWPNDDGERRWTSTSRSYHSLTAMTAPCTTCYCTAADALNYL
jgi:hypothetical protein